MTAGERAWICDVGFPLPVLLRPAGEIETPLGAVRVSSGGRGLASRAPRACRRGPASSSSFPPRSRTTSSRTVEGDLPAGLEFPRGGSAAADGGKPGDLLRERRGARGRPAFPLTVPLPGRPRSVVSELFGVDEELLGRRSIASAIRSRTSPTRALVAYLETASGADRGVRGDRDAAGYRAPDRGRRRRRLGGGGAGRVARAPPRARRGVGGRAARTAPSSSARGGACAVERRGTSSRLRVLLRGDRARGTDLPRAPA